MTYLTDAQITAMADDVLRNHEVSPLSHGRKCEIAREHAEEFFGVTPSRTAVLLSVKIANLGWAGIVARTKRELAA